MWKDIELAQRSVKIWNSGHAPKGRGPCRGGLKLWRAMNVPLEVGLKNRNNQTKSPSNRQHICCWNWRAFITARRNGSKAWIINKKDGKSPNMKIITSISMKRNFIRARRPISTDTSEIWFKTILKLEKWAWKEVKIRNFKDGGIMLPFQIMYGQIKNTKDYIHDAWKTSKYSVMPRPINQCFYLQNQYQ